MQRVIWKKRDFFFFHQPVLPVWTQKWEEGINEGKGTEAQRKDSLFIPPSLSYIS